ncbi:hypothetical protein L798_11484 [Zootermopsis nevadensis]|uniref:Uncharacterized protein n=1 Tax=Zootermopsis nevadensis TaxID=136037 RepID=A0A067QE94_ZOONE|nr:hypothetical protein L798_11484 [Zootermopsis nevadensis]
MLLSAVFATASLLVSTALPYQSFLPKFVENVWNGATSRFSNLYHLPGFITGNVIDGVNVVHYGVGNWTDIVSGLGFLPQGNLNASAVIDIKGISKIRHPYQIGASLQIGGAVIPVEGSSSNRSVVIGDAGSRGSDFIGNATGIIVSTDDLDENGFLNGTWGYMPLRTESIQSHTGSALVKVTGSGGEKQQVVIPVVRPVIPTIVGNDSGSTQVQRLTVLNILQSNLINVLSFLLQTSPIISNAKMLAVVETLHNKLLSAQLNVDFILPQLEQLMSLSLLEQLEIVLKSFISIVEPDFGFQLQYLINYLKEPKVADLIFTHQIPNLTGGIDQSWALPWVLAPPSYNPADANSFMNNALGQLLIHTIKSSDKNAIKYNIYLILTTVPLGLEPRTVRQIRNLASILYALNSNIWEMISQQLPSIPTTNVYDGLKAFLQLVINIQGVPQQVTFIIKNIIHAIPDTTAVTTKVTQIPTRVTLFPQPENSHPIYPQPQDPSKSQYKSQRPPEPTKLPYSSHQLEPQNHQPEFPSQNKSENELQSQPNYPPHQPKPQNQFHSQYPHQNEFYQPQTKTPLPQNPQQPETEHKSQPQYGKLQQPQQTTRQSEPQPSAQYQSQSPLPPYQLEPQNATQPGIQHQPLYPPHETELQRQNQSQSLPQYALPQEPESQSTQIPLIKSQSQPQHPPYRTQPQPQSQPLNATRQEIQHQPPQYTLHAIELQSQNQSQLQPQYTLPLEPESQPTQLPLNKSKSQPQHPPYQTQPQPQSQPLNATRQEIQHQPPQYTLHAIELQSQNQSQLQPQYTLPLEPESQPTQLPLNKSQSQPQHPPYRTQPQPQSQPLNATRQEIQHQPPQYTLHAIELQSQNQSQLQPQYTLPLEPESQPTHKASKPVTIPASICTTTRT